MSSERLVSRCPLTPLIWASRLVPRPTSFESLHVLPLLMARTMCDALYHFGPVLESCSQPAFTVQTCLYMEILYISLVSSRMFLLTRLGAVILQ
jgi:hypothetical protein